MAAYTPLFTLSLTVNDQASFTEAAEEAVSIACKLSLAISFAYGRKAYRVTRSTNINKLVEEHQRDLKLNEIYDDSRGR